MTNPIKQQSIRVNGDFRYYADIAEFFDCKTLKKHYMGQEGLYYELIKQYHALNLKPKEDVYVRAEGFYREEEQKFDIDPVDVFVITKIIKMDSKRSCKQPYRRGL
jgi:hypothetical protein